jgi:trans-L-3-hydroxyproline dehydratase
MRVEISESVNFELYDAVIPEVTGTAYFTGQHQFWFDPDDPLKKGFIFR